MNRTFGGARSWAALMMSRINSPLGAKAIRAYARLADYKVLEAKHADQAAAGGDNQDFLWQSDIRVSLHYNPGLQVCEPDATTSWPSSRASMTW